MSREEEPVANLYRMSEKGLEPIAAGDEQGRRGKSHGTGFGDAKKVALLVGLAVAAAGVVAYQFTRGGGPQVAVASPPAAAGAPDAAVAVAAGAPAPPPAEVDSVLQQIERPDAATGEEGLSLAQVEQLVKQFDGYVERRQVPLQSLLANPFEVRLPEPPKPQVALGAAAAKDEPTPAETAAAARKQQIHDAASRLALGSVLVTGQRRWATISGKLCRVGDAAEGFRVQAIEPDHVVLTCEDETVNLRLRPEAGSQKDH